MLRLYAWAAFSAGAHRRSVGTRGSWGRTRSTCPGSVPRPSGKWHGAARRCRVLQPAPGQCGRPRGAPARPVVVRHRPRGAGRAGVAAASADPDGGTGRVGVPRRLDPRRREHADVGGLAARGGRRRAVRRHVLVSLFGDTAMHPPRGNCARSPTADRGRQRRRKNGTGWPGISMIRSNSSSSRFIPAAATAQARFEGGPGRRGGRVEQDPRLGARGDGRDGRDAAGLARRPPRERRARSARCSRPPKRWPFGPAPASTSCPAICRQARSLPTRRARGSRSAWRRRRCQHRAPRPRRQQRHDGQSAARMGPSC